MTAETDRLDDPTEQLLARRRPRVGTIRPMTEADIPEVGRLFFRVFRKGRTRPSRDFEAYFKRAFFTAPSYHVDVGSLVHVDAYGRIDAVLSAVPMQIAAGERVVTGRLLCTYMEEPEARSIGAAQLMLTVRARLQDFVFSDSAAPVSADHARAMGGQILSVQSLEWRRTFRPVRRFSGRLAQRLPPLGWFGLPALTAPADAALRRFSPSRQATPCAGFSDEPMGRDAFIALAPKLIERFAVRPVWSETELRWLLDRAEENVKAGRLHLRRVQRVDGRTIGCFAYYGRKGSAAQVLNVMTEPGSEADVVAQMHRHLDTAGYSDARGMAQPFLMNALLRQPHTEFRYRGYFGIGSRHPDIRDAVARGDLYIGGLAGESWSRLLTDF